MFDWADKPWSFKFVDFNNNTIEKYEDYFEYDKFDQSNMMISNRVRGLKFLLITFDTTKNKRRKGKLVLTPESTLFW